MNTYFRYYTSLSRDSHLMYTELVKFAQYLDGEKKSQFTINAYVKDIEQLLSSISIKKITDLSEDILENYIQELISNSIFSKKTTSRKVNSIRKFVNFINQKYKLKIDSKKLKAPKPLIKKQRILKKEEINIIRNHLRTDVKCFTMFEVLLQTGIRISELAALTLDQLDLTNRNLILTAPTTKQARTIPLNDKIYYILKDYINSHKDSTCEYIFHTSNLKPMQIRNIRLVLDRAFKKVNLENIMVNDLRNTFIVRQLEALNDPVFVSHIVGHSSLAATLRYEKLAQIGNKKRNRKEVVEI